MTERQVEHLAAAVERRLGELGERAVRAPPPGAYRAERHWLPMNEYDLSVEIDIGPTTLLLRSSNGWGPSLFGPDTDLERLAGEIVAHVSSALSDQASIDELIAFEAKCRDKIRRDRSDLELSHVRFAPGTITYLTPLSERAFWVTVRLVDDVLLPYDELIRAGTVRIACRELKKYGASGRTRRAVVDRLAANEAVLEIESVAEYAILAAGRSVADVANSMIASRVPGNGYGRMVRLWGDDGDDKHVTVVVRDGCIRLEANLPELRWTADGRIGVRRAFPETVLAALVGRPLRNLVGHPLLGGDAIINKVVGDEFWHTDVWIERPVRPIRRTELQGIALPTPPTPLYK